MERKKRQRKRKKLTESITNEIVMEKKSAFVLAGTVRHVCGELKRKRNNIYKVPMDVNEEIIASL